MQPQIITPETGGRHNSNLAGVIKRLDKSQSYSDQSTVIICPCRGQIPAKVVGSWIGLMRPMNQKVMGPMFALGMEVGVAYNQLVELILGHPELSKYRYICTIEEDNCVPADGLIKLYEAIEGKVNGQKYDVVGGLYFTKGESGQPMIYGDPKVMPKTFIPQKPVENSIVEANGLGMGFNLFRTSVFKKVEKPWFKSQQEVVPGVGSRVCSQDLYFYEKAAAHGLRFACDCRVKVGHYDLETDILW